MNKKKRALALGLAATQLSALTAVVAPLTAVVAVAETVNIDGKDHTVTLPATATGYTVSATADGSNIKVSITIGSGYVAAANAAPTTGAKDGSNASISFTEEKTGDAVTGWSATFAPDSSAAGTYNFSDLSGVKVLKVINPKIALPTGTTGVNITDKTETEDTSHSAAIDEARKIAFTVEESGGASLTKDTDYSIDYAWVEGSAGAPGKVVATLKLTTTAEAKYSLGDSASVTVDVPVTYKAAAKALTFTVDSTVNMGEFTAEPQKADIDKAIKDTLSFKVDGSAPSPALVENTDYTVTIAAKTGDTTGKVYTVTVTPKDADAYTIAQSSQDVTISYTVAAAKTNITPTIANISFDNELDVAPTADDVKAKITAVTFAEKTGSNPVTGLTLGTDYTVTVARDDTGSTPTYTATIALENTDAAKKYAFDGTDNEITLTVDYTLKSNVTIASIVNNVTPVTANNLANELEVKLVDAEGNDLTGGSAKVKEGAALTLTVKPKTGFAFKSESALNVSAALTTASSTAITPTNNNDGTYTIAVPALDADDTLTITLTGALETKTSTVTDFEFGYGTGKTSYEVDYKTALSDTAIKGALELTSITTADGKITEAAELAKFELSVTVDSTAGTATVTITSKDSAYEIDGGLVAKNVKIVKTVTVASADVLSGANLTYAVTSSTLTAANVKTAVESQVNTAVTALTATGGKFVDLSGILTFTPSAATLDTATGNYKVSVTPSIAAASADAYKLTSETPLEYTITVTKLDVTPGSIALKASAREVTLPTNKAGTTEDDIKSAVLAALDDISFTVTSGGGSVTLTETTDYTVDVTAVNTTTKKATVTVAPVASSMATFTAKKQDIDFVYTATKLVAPTTTADASNRISIAGNGDVETLVLETITPPANATMDDFTISVDHSTFDSASSGDNSTVDVKFTIKDTDNFAWDTSVTQTGGVVTVTVNVTKAADVPVITPTFGGKYIVGTPAETLYVNGKLTADSIKTTLGADLTASFTKPDAAGTGTEDITNEVATGDWEPVVTYSTGTTATIGIKLTAAGAAKYVLASTPVTATITVKRAYDLPSATTATIATPFANGTTAADIKTVVEAKVAELFTTAADYTITSATPITADGEQTVDVTVSPKDTNGVFDNTAHDGSVTVTVTYTVSAATPAGNAVTVNAATNGTVNADKTTAASGDTVTLTIAPSTGYKLGTLTITGASGAVTPTKVNDTKYTFEMPAETVTVSATFVADDTPAATYDVNVTKTGTGTITVTPTGKVAAGAEVTIAATPGSGYKLGSITVKQGSTAITVTNNKFTMPAGDVTVTVTFTKKSSGGGSSSGGHSSGGHSSGSSSGSSSSAILSDIGSSSKGDTVEAPYGTTILISSMLENAADKDVSLSVPVNSTYTWTIDAKEMESTDSSIILSVTDATVSKGEVAKVEGKPITDTMAFTTKAKNLGKSATLTVSTPARPTAAQPKFANLYKMDENGKLTFVDVVPVDSKGKAVLPISEAGSYSVLISDETKKTGDVDNNCKVDLNDLSAALELFVNASKTLTRGDNFKLDFDNSGVVHLDDISKMLKDFVNGKLK